jgi:hypothetical protein
MSHSPFHKHKWVVIYHIGENAVRRCDVCTAEESFLYDFSRMEWVWVEGNYHYDSRPHFILAGNRVQFLYAQELLLAACPILNPEQIQRLVSREQLLGLKKPTILFYGEWWDNVEVLMDNEITTMLNSRI